MSVVQKHIEHLEVMSDSVEEVAKEIVEDNIEKIIELLKQTQLSQGKYYDGSPLKWHSGSGYYAPITEKYWAKQDPKPRKPKKTGEPYNFEWTGTTFDTMVIQITQNNSFSILTRDGKQKLLEEIYGSNLFKLSEENNTLINNTIIAPELANWIEKLWWQTI